MYNTACFFQLCHAGCPALGMVPYVIPMGLIMSNNKIKEIPQGCDQMFISQIILDPTKLIIKSNYYKGLIVYKIRKG